jgi:hypothetical protein
VPARWLGYYFALGVHKGAARAAPFLLGSAFNRSALQHWKLPISASQGQPAQQAKNSVRTTSVRSEDTTWSNPWELGQLSLSSNQ